MLRRCATLAPVRAFAIIVSSCVALRAQETTFEDTVTLEPGGRLSLDTTRGSVRLTSWDRPMVEIRARIEPPRGRGVDADYARRAVDGTTIEVEGCGRSVRIRTDYDGVLRQGVFGGWRNVPRVHYEIRAPRQLDVDLDIDRSDTTVQGFEGRLRFDLDRSDLDASDLAGTITIKLNLAELLVSDLTGDLSLDLDRGQRVVLDGISGSLRLDIDRTNVTMRNVRINDDSHVDIDRGDLVIELVETQPLTIAADMSRRGDFSSDLPVTMRQTGRNFRGTINGGGPELRIEADRSDVRLRAIN